MSGHTPGPWVVGNAMLSQNVAKCLGPRHQIPIHAGDGNCHTIVYSGGPGATKTDVDSLTANARLIAESPALLAFAKWAMGQLCGDSGTGESHWEQFKEFRDGQSAIAKAEGKQ